MYRFPIKILKDAYQTIKDNHQAVFMLYYHEIDPLQVSYVNYFGQVYLEEVNRRILVQVTKQGQQEASAVDADLQSAHDNLDKMHQALQAGIILSAHQHLGALSQNLYELSLGVGAGLALLGNVEQTLGSAVIALLLQHLAVTMAALSIVRENSFATMELFRVSPISAGETLLGKYLSYMIFGLSLIGVLTVFLIYGLKLPMLGSWAG